MHYIILLFKYNSKKDQSTQKIFLGLRVTQIGKFEIFIKFSLVDYILHLHIS